MGQTSSQLDSTQVQQQVNVEEAPVTLHNSRSSTPPDMGSQPPTRKHARALSSSQDVQPGAAKKLKTTSNSEATKTKPRAGRSVPQHVRGINIRPSQDSNALRDLNPATSQNTQRPGSSGSEGSALIKQASNNTNAVTFDNVQHDGLHARQKHDVTEQRLQQNVRANDDKESIANVDEEASSEEEETSSEEDETSSEEDEADDMIGEEIVVSQVGAPGPRGAKQPRSSQLKVPKSNTLHDSATQANSNTTADRSPAAPAAAPTDPESQRARQKTALAKGQKVMAQNPEFAERFMNEEDKKMKRSMLRDFITDFDLDPILFSMFFAGEQQEDEARDEVEKSAAIEADEVASRVRGTRVESAIVNPPGQPGPRRKRRKQTQEQQQQTSAEAEDVDARAGNARVTSTNEAASQKIVASPVVQRTEQELKPTQDTTSTSRQRRNHIPTPPTSLEQQDLLGGENDVEPVSRRDATPTQVERNDPPTQVQTPGYANAQRQVSTWLHDPQSPANPDIVPASKGSPKVAKTKKKKPSQRKKAVARKSAEKIEDSDNDQYEAPEEKSEDNVSEAESEPETGRRKSQKKTNFRGTAKGTWTTDEIAIADKVFDAVCNQFRCTAYELCHEMNDWGGVYPEFKQQIYHAFPLRTKNSIRAFCQRRWHDQNTGQWTAEEDAELIKQYAKFPGNWVEIACEIPGGRTAASCRDRWVSVLQYKGKLNFGPWTNEEEDKLTRIIERQLEKRSEEGKRVDWNRVAQEMDGTRSARKCQVKWKAMQRRKTPKVEAAQVDEDEGEDEDEDEDTMLQHSIMAQMQPDSHQTGVKQEVQPMSKKQRALDRAYSKLGWGDVYDALYEISYSFTKAELDKEFGHESTFWSIVGVRVGKRDKASKFKSNPKLRRRCYYGALETFGDEEVEQCKTLAKKAGVVFNKLLLAHCLGKIELEDKYGVKPKKVARKRPRGASRTENWLDEVEPPSSSPPPYPPFDDGEEVIVPETQLEDAVAGAEQVEQGEVREVANDNEDAATASEIPISSIESRADSPSNLQTGAPTLALKDFVKRCANGRNVEMPKRAIGKAGEEFIELTDEQGQVYRFYGTEEQFQKAWEYAREQWLADTRAARQRL